MFLQFGHEVQIVNHTARSQFSIVHSIKGFYQVYVVHPIIVDIHVDIRVSISIFSSSYTVVGVVEVYSVISGYCLAALFDAPS